MLVVKNIVIHRLLRKPEQQEALGGREDNVKVSV
jgi:hypothetical protein